ncbi:MAG: DUF4062 domain-containing protein, partial [Clostridiales bacterium]|nr:DUF4062 domain-containing protein [Clostridiales bacterium]
MKKSNDWQNVYVFISSTFNDMHAERDYLVKRVFPALSEWCEKKHLNLVDIDLRWGVSEADATENKRVVQLCLERIDECRPFFLCFLGQRRGWVPDFENDIDPETKNKFDKLDKYKGSSITEIEITHARIDPLHNGKFFDSQGKEYDGSIVEHSFFYLRKDDYLKNLPDGERKYIYTNATPENSESEKAEDEKLKEWREIKIPATMRPVNKYSADWLSNERTNELLWPLNVPTASPKNSETWKSASERWAKRWNRVGVKTDGETADKNAADLFNEKITQGRLGNFSVGDKELSELIVEQLTEAISTRFNLSDTEKIQTPLAGELEEQSKTLHLLAQGYIPFDDSLNAIKSYIDSENNRPLLIRANTGIGKSSLLAYYLSGSKNNAYFRFIGTSKQSSNKETLLNSLREEFLADGFLKNSKYANESVKSWQFFDLLADVSNNTNTPIILILDALDQLDGGVLSVDFIRPVLPPKIKMIVSYQGDAEDAENFAENLLLSENVYQLQFSASKEIKSKLITEYFRNYFKQLDESLLNLLLDSKGSDNPLFLKIVLNELRVFGSYENMRNKINELSGSTPEEAFIALIKRVSKDFFSPDINSEKFVMHFFGWLSHSRDGLSATELADLLCENNIVNDRQSALDTVFSICRQLRSFIVLRNGCYVFFYRSFLKAAIQYCEGNSWHLSLAEFFANKDFFDLRRLRELAYHYAKSEQTEKYYALIGDFKYLNALINNFGVSALVDDCSFIETDDTDLLKAFLHLSSGVLQAHPELLGEELFARCGGIENNFINTLLQSVVKNKFENNEVWLRPKFAFLESPDSKNLRQFSLGSEGKLSCTLSPDGKFAVYDMVGKIFRMKKIENWSAVHDFLVDGFSRKALFSPDGIHLALSYVEGAGSRTRISVYNCKTMKHVCDLEISLAQAYNGSMVIIPERYLFTPNGKQIIAPTKENSLS